MTLLTTSHEVKNLCNKLQNEAFICIDTEFIREKYYYPKLCLIQIGDSKGNGWAIDPLSKNINLDPLYNLLINEKILKVLHSPRQDFEIIFNILKKIPKPIFDTQSAAMTCGYGDSASYELLVNKIVNVKIDKRMYSTFTSFDQFKKEEYKKEESNVKKNNVMLMDLYLYEEDNFNTIDKIGN